MGIEFLSKVLAHYEPSNNASLKWHIEFQLFWQVRKPLKTLQREPIYELIAEF